MSTFEVFETAAGGRIKAWVKGVPVEDAAREQLENVAGLPFVHSHLAVMPDVHFGRGATVGSVIPTKGAIIPAAVGVDIGCGMMAVETTLRAEHLPDSLAKLRSEIERKAPAGVGRNGEWGTIPDSVASRWRNSDLEPRLDRIRDKHRKIPNHKVGSQLGTLGSGNHFIEVCLDERGFVWVMLHSGSRGTGNQIGQYFIEAARKALEKRVLGYHVPDQDLAFFVEGEPIFDDYIEAVGWAQDYARANREAMMERTLQAMREQLPKFKLGKHAVNCHHNYVEKEHHFGADVWVTRKGAVRAGDGRAWHHPGVDGREIVHRARQRQPGLVLLVLARRRPRDVAHQGEGDVHAEGSPRGDRRRRMPQGPGRDRRNADGLQGHRRRHRGAGRPDRGGSHA